jgi:aspartate racemase
VKGEVLEADKATILSIIENFKNAGAECVILACTDLPILLSQSDTSFPLIDTMDLLAEAARKCNNW